MNFKQITSGSGSYIDVAFTPQGKLLYSSRAKGLGDLWMMDADDRNHIELTNNAGGNYSPVSSPDGRFISSPQAAERHIPYIVVLQTAPKPTS